jgi:hypothetical protein
MSTAMTFNSLKADVKSYLERGGVSDITVFNQLPSLVGLAERAIARKLKVTGVINVVTSTLVAGVGVYSKPDRWRRTTSMEYGAGAAQSRKPLFTRSYEYCREYWPDAALRGDPLFYSDFDYSHWLIVPTPVATVPWQIIYYQQPPLLEAANQTNWLTDLAPAALLYRTLLECEPYLKNDARIATWRNLYDEATEAITMEDLEKMTDRSSDRTGD